MRELQINRVYRHFKGDYYLVIDVAYNSETKEKYVVYRALYGDNKLWIRPYDMFMSEVDNEKYPDVKQKYRLELADIPEAFQGFPITLISAALMSIAFLGFTGLIKL